MIRVAGDRHGGKALAQLEITTLGTERVSVDDREIPALSGTKAGLLLIYLVAESPRRVPRRELAELFWPELDSNNARVNLRQGLFQIRRHLGDTLAENLQAATRDVGFRVDDRCHADFLRVAAEDTSFGPAFVAPAEASPEDALNLADRELARLELYQGHFLATDAVAEGLPRLEAWVRQQRDVLWSHARAAVERLHEYLRRAGEPERGIREMRRLLDLAPADEPLNAVFLRTLLLAGQPARAEEHYRRVEQLLEETDGHAPGPALAEIREQLERARDDGVQRTDRAPAPATALRQERRRLVLVVCDLRAPEHLDIEEQWERIRTALETLDALLLAHHGHVVRAPGQGLLAYFGYPAGREEAMMDAVRAAWQALGTAPSGVELRAAVDIDTVVTGDDPDIPDPAGRFTARVQAVARSLRPGILWVSAAVRENLEGFFEFQPWRGRPGGFRVIEDPGPRDRVDARPATRQAPLAGRDAELRRLRGEWDRARRGGSRWVLIQGEAGMGKSRLARGLAEQVDGHGVVRALKCREDTARQLLAPVRQTLGRWAATRNRRAAAERLLRRLLQRHGEAAEKAATIAGWLTCPTTPDHELFRSGNVDRDHLLDALVDLTLTGVRGRALLLIVDDLHWMDSATSEFLRRLHHRGRDAALMVVLTTRMSYRSEWRDVEMESIVLQGLDNAAAGHLVAALDPGQALPRTVRDELVARGEGVPLFLEELTRFALEHGHPGTPGDELPPGLNNLLIARMEQLGPARELARAAAVIGRDFSVNILARLLERSTEHVRQQLGLLMRKGFVEPAGVSEGNLFRFRHALYRESALEAMLRSERSRLHDRLADLLQEEAERPYGAPAGGRVAVHLHQAGRYREAVTHWLQAGEQAFARGMLPEAAQHFQDALDCLQNDLADSASLNEADTLRALSGLGSASLALMGYGSRTVHGLFERAAELSRPERDPVEHFRVLWGLWHGAGSCQGFDEAARLAHEAEVVAERSGDRLLRIAAGYVQGNTCFWTGHFRQAMDHQTRTLELYQPRDHPRLIARHTENPAILSRAFFAWTLLFSGNHERAWVEMDRACQHADQLDHRPTQAFVYSFRSALGFFADRPHETLAASRKAHDIAEAYDYPLWRTGAVAVSAWARTRLGDDQAVDIIREQVEIMRSVMDGVSTLFRLFLLDAIRRGAPDPQECLAIADAALDNSLQRGDRCFQPTIRLQRARSLLELAHGADPEGWQELERARADAREQGNPNVERLVLLEVERHARDPDWRQWVARSLRQVDQCIIGNPGAEALSHDLPREA
ncbi:AAA family ATPase [Thioalkalivibrio sp. ALE23]|uniref:AAA family ATPase n=1 Tax=Thioalkalivibrio sp. ALE23 TaxID=1265495 RepID=UPI00035D1838|nr:AAA family ATPase [Thioalkalivibrio sp. ALE23]